MSTNLDAFQVLRLAYDEVNNRIRTDASLSLDSAEISVDLDHSDDSIKVGDGVDFLQINSDGTISVKQSGTWDINNIIGTISLPTGAATEATITSIDSKTIKADTDNVVNKAFAIQLDDTSTPNVTYIGKAIPGSLTSAAVWQVSKIDESSNLAITFADGDSDFDNIWDDRTSLTYG